MTVEGPGQQGHEKTLELGTMKRAYERLLMKVKPVEAEDSSILEMPIT